MLGGPITEDPAELGILPSAFRTSQRGFLGVAASSVSKNLRSGLSPLRGGKPPQGSPSCEGHLKGDIFERMSSLGQ